MLRNQCRAFVVVALPVHLDMTGREEKPILVEVPIVLVVQSQGRVVAVGLMEPDRLCHNPEFHYPQLNVVLIEPLVMDMEARTLEADDWAQ